jgi:uncharacterized membrane protein
MRDAYVIHGQKITYMDKEWTIGVIYFIPNNPKLYVQLKSGITSMNVELLSVINLITNNVENYHYDNKV